MDFWTTASVLCGISLFAAEHHEHERTEIYTKESIYLQVMITFLPKNYGVAVLTNAHTRKLHQSSVRAVE